MGLKSICTKVLGIMLFCFFTKLLLSCRTTPVDFTYNVIQLCGVDNSGNSIMHGAIDTMYSEAVCIKLTLSDSVNYYALSKIGGVASALAFNTASALSVEHVYVPLLDVVSIGIVTLYDIDNDIKAGDDIGGTMLYASGDYYCGLYNYRDWAISEFNDDQSYSGCSMFLFLKEEVQNTQAKFRVDVALSNGTVLSDTTSTFFIIPTGS